MLCFFVSDLHGHQHRYEQLFTRIVEEVPDAVFLGGDLLPSHARSAAGLYPPVTDFIDEYFAVRFRRLKEEMGERYPRVFLIFGNDDPRVHEAQILDESYKGLWTYLHNTNLPWREYALGGYAYVPPTPFQRKDWERYDVSRYLEPGCIAPEDGRHSVPLDARELRYRTIQEDLAELTAEMDVPSSIMLFHSPPYKTKLDRAALDGKMIDHAPLDVHVGSVAIKRFIEQRQPLITLHGHIHESASITGEWKEQIGRSWCYSAAHNGRELALVRFDPAHPEDAKRELC
ncbi:MAG: hypothetical protein C0600_13655 [Ignavibacteria bacterium]|nr:MAG: hypothetical protein C0600_13655 [Ignavibacteria bacterium]